VSDPREGYVSRFHRYLEEQQGRQLGLVNLGVSGESSISIMSEGQLDNALNVLRTQEVAILTIDLGANDLLSHVGSDQCLDNPRGAACQQRIQAAFTSFSSNFAVILGQLKAELPDGAEFYVMTIYNPFDFGVGLPIEDFSSEVIEQLNDLIEAAAGVVGANVADPFDDMADNAGAWTNMLSAADIHPNAEGFQTLAFSLAEAREE
jgi:lysophospholipase L1-like esterase